MRVRSRPRFLLGSSPKLKSACRAPCLEGPRLGTIEIAWLRRTRVPVSLAAWLRCLFLASSAGCGRIGLELIDLPINAVDGSTPFDDSGVDGIDAGSGDTDADMAQCEQDTDGDGTADCDDGCPDDSAKLVAGSCGCGVSEADSDGDGCSTASTLAAAATIRPTCPMPPAASATVR